MADDLERFLQQAAERLANKMNQPQRQVPPPVKQKQPVRRAERQIPQYEPEIPDDEILEAELIPPSQLERSAGPSRLSYIDTRPELAEEIGQTDERMVDHLHEVFDPSDNLLGRTAAEDKAMRKNNDVTDVTKRKHDSSPMVEMFRNPGTLKAAFIAGEIFRRKIT